MILLPRILCYFHTLLVTIPATELRKFPAQLLKFIWGPKGHRLVWCTLYIPRDFGRLGVPDLKKYYRAAQLAQRIQIYYKSYSSKWIALEVQAYAPLPMDLLMWIPPNNRKTSSVPHSLQLLDSSCKSALQSPHTPVAPIFWNMAFLPGLSLHEFHCWVKKGLYCIDNFLDHKGFLHPLQQTTDDCTIRTVSENRFHGEAQRGGISALYKQFVTATAKFPYRLAWERNLGAEIAKDDLNAWALWMSPLLTTYLMVFHSWASLLAVPSIFPTVFPGVQAGGNNVSHMVDMP